MKTLNKDTKQLEIVYKQYANQLFRTAYSLLFNNHDAQDVVSDVFVKYMTCEQKFNDEDHEKAWLIRVTINMCRDLHRKNKHRNHDNIEDYQEILGLDNEKDKELVRELMYEIETLPTKIREVIVLHYFEGFQVEEISGMLGLSLSAVKMRLKRGRDILKQQIKENEDE